MKEDTVVSGDDIIWEYITPVLAWLFERHPDISPDDVGKAIARFLIEWEKGGYRREIP